MSTCIRAGVRYNKHIYRDGSPKCVKCGRVKEIFSQPVEDTGIPEQPQAEPQVSTAQQDGWDKFYAEKRDVEQDDFPSDHQPE